MIILYELLSDNYRSKSWPDAFVDSLLAIMQSAREHREIMLSHQYDAY